MKRFFILLLTLILESATLNAAAKKPEVLFLNVGGTTTVSISSDEDIHITPKKIIKAIDLGDKLKVIGLKPGVSLMRTKSRQLKFVVLSPQKNQFYMQSRELINQFLGLQLDFTEGELQLSGQLHRFSDWLDISKVSSPISLLYYFKAQISSTVKDQAFEHFKKSLHKRNLPQVKLILQPQAKVYIAEEFKNLNSQWESIFYPFGIPIEYSKALLPVIPIIKVNVHIAEINRSAHQEFGLRWPTLEGTAAYALENSNQNLLIQLKAIETRGLGQVLAKPSLISESGGEANFHSGGEFPIKIMSYKAKNVVWKKHGILLKIQPKADSSEHIHLNVEAEVSLLDMGQSFDGIPSLKVNRVNAQLNIKSKQTIALSGLLQNQWGTSNSGLAYLLRVPILGRLFSSQSFLQQKSELIIFVTPEIISSKESQPIKLPKNWRTADEL